MLKLVPITLIMIALAFFSDAFSQKKPLNTGYIYNEKFLWVFIAIAVSVFVGLRTNYNDTFYYIHAFNSRSPELDFSKVDFSFGANPGYVVVNMLLRHFNVTANGFLMVYSVITYFIYIWFIHKYSSDFFTSILLFICLVFTFPMAAVKQCIAVAFCLVAVDKAVNKKWFWFVFWLFIAETFHAYSFLYLMVPLLFFIPWSDKKTWYWIGIFFFMGILLKPLLGTILSVTDSLGEDYTAESFSGEGINPFRLLVALVPLVLSYFLKKEINDPKNELTETEGLFMNLSFLNGELMFVALFGTANYFGRLANYFYIFPIIALPRLFNMINPRLKSVVRVIAVICYFMFFYYSNVLAYSYTFDEQFIKIALKDFHFFVQ